MKKSTTIPSLLISLAYLSPIFTIFYFRNELAQSIKTDGSDPFSSMILIAYGIHIIRYFKSIFNSQVTDNQALINRLNAVWALFYLSISGLIFYYAYHYEPNRGYNSLLILFGIFMMIDGNYQSVILPKNSAFESRIIQGYEDNVHRKSQRLKGRFQFYLGLAILIIFLVLPNNPQILLFGIGGILLTYYLGSWWIMYKNTQIIADSEAKKN